MRKLFLLACFLGPLVAPATAQKRSVVAGLGVGFDLGDSPYEVLFGFSGTNTARLLVPIMVSRRIRLQPSVSYFKATRGQSFSGQTDKQSFRRWGLGLAIHYLFPVKKSMQAYVGAAAEFGKSKDEQSNPFGGGSSSSTTRSDRTLSVLGGGDYFFSPRFSVGGEVRLDFATIGDPNVDIVPPPPVPFPDVDEDLSVTQTNAQVIVRRYFGDAN